MLEHIRKIFTAQAGQPVASATQQEEAVLMTDPKETPELSAGIPAELTAALATSESALTTLQASFAELEAKYAEAQTALSALAASKQDLEAKAAEAKQLKRKESLETAVGTVKASTLLSTLSVLDDAAFESVVSAMTANLDAEAKSEAFTEKGVTAEADPAKVVEESVLEAKLKQKYRA